MAKIEQQTKFAQQDVLSSGHEDTWRCCLRALLIDCTDFSNRDYCRYVYYNSVNMALKSTARSSGGSALSASSVSALSGA